MSTYEVLKQCARRVLVAVCLTVMASGAALAQDPSTFQGMTPEEVQREAERLGIDLSNPAEAIRRARNMGIPESRIQELLRAYQRSLGLDNQQLGNTTPRVSRPAEHDTARRSLTAADAWQEARRFGIDLSNPERAIRQARDAGISDSRIREWLRAVRGTSEGDEEEGEMLPPPSLIRLPQISPAGFEIDEQPELVSVTVEFRSPEQPTSIWSGSDAQADSQYADPELEFPGGILLPGGSFQRRSDTARFQGMNYPARRDSQRVMVTRALPSDVDLYFLSASRKDTLHADRVQKVISGTMGDIWMGTVLVPPTTEPGAWTLVVETVNGSGTPTSRMDPAGFLRIQGESLQEITYFGYDTFEREPGMDPELDQIGPVSDGYVVGPNDELRLTVWGAAEFQYDLPVDPEGRIYVPNVGQLTVAGKRLDQLREDVRGWLSRRYAGLTDQPPSVFMDLTVTRLRPLRVFVLGEVPEPGSYTVPSGSSVFDALYAVGGPLTRGSLRSVQVVRGDQVAEVDLYDYLVRAFRPQPVQLQTGDHVFVPPRGNTVTIEGAVRRPAIYELKDEETVDDLIAYAGGLTAEAYSEQFQIERILPFRQRRNPSDARTVMDFNLEDMLTGRDSVALRDGDRVEIFTIPKRDTPMAQLTVPAVKVAGAVFKPGRYELGDGIETVRDLIDHADGLSGDAFLPKAELVRYRADLDREIVALDLEKVLADVPTHNVVLRPQDSLYVYSVQKMRGERVVEISGQVREPGEYPFFEGMTVGDLLAQGGGLHDPEFRKEVFLGRADIFRRSPDGSTERIIPFDLADALNGEGAADEPIMPEDELRIYPAEVNDVRDRFVAISGAVKEPGTYRYRDGMTLEDLVLQAGGFRENAQREEVQITRADGDADGRVAQLSIPFNESAAFAISGLGGTDELYASRDTLNVAGSDRGFVLEHRDRVYVRSIPQFYEGQHTVQVHGEVRYPGEYTLVHPNEAISSVIQRAGGILPSGYSTGTQMYREGDRIVVEMERALRGRTDADLILQNGDEIVVPARPNTVAVLGNVGQETHIKYVPGKRVSYYIDRAGGLRRGTEAVLLTQPSGATYRLREQWIFPRENPRVEDGAVIRATIEPYAELAQRDGFDWSSTLRSALGVASSALTIMLLYQRINSE